jgi:hypothetical protein
MTIKSYWDSASSGLVDDKRSAITTATSTAKAATRARLEAIDLVFMMTLHGTFRGLQLGFCGGPIRAAIGAEMVRRFTVPAVRTLSLSSKLKPLSSLEPPC